MQPAEVLKFWCETCQPEDWYRQDDALDAAIRDQFGDAVAAAQEGAFAEWEDSAEGMLALIILLDQFARNIYRGDGRSFAGDGRARKLARLAVERGFVTEYPMPERQFFLMPFMHSENLADQDAGIDLMQQYLMPEGEQNVQHAHVHREVIVRYGRFPYRNDALGRDSTPQEQDFLDAGGYGAIVREMLGDPADG